MDSIFSLTTCFALLGGFLGSLVVSDIKRYGKILTLILVVIGMVFAAAITEYLFPPEHPWLFAGAGVFAGMVTTSLLDTFKATAPKLSQKIINSVYNKAERIIGSKTETNRKD